MDECDKVQYFEFPYVDQKWKRYTKQERENLDRKISHEPDKRFEQVVFPWSDPLSRKRFFPTNLTPKERRELIVRYLAMAGLRMYFKPRAARAP